MSATEQCVAHLSASATQGPLAQWARSGRRRSASGAGRPSAWPAELALERVRKLLTLPMRSCSKWIVSTAGERCLGPDELHMSSITCRLLGPCTKACQPTGFGDA